MLKRLFFDVETSPNIVYSWRIGYKVPLDYNNIIKERAIICVCWKWEHENHVWSLQWEDGNDAEMLREFMEVLNESDEAIAHNGDRFDLPWLRTRCIKHGIDCFPTYKTIDTLKLSRGNFYFNSNRLDYISKFLGGKGKIPTNFDLWKSVMAGDKKALEEMTEYCITPDHKLLGSDMVWREANQFSVGDVILGFDEEGPSRFFKSSTIQSIKYDVQPVFMVQFSSGAKIKTTAEHRWLVSGSADSSGRSYHWKETQNLKTMENTKDWAKKKPDRVPKLLDVWNENMSKEAGWLAGIFDGEGCLSTSGSGYGYNLAVAQNPGITLNEIERLVYKYHGPQACKETKAGHSCQTIRLNGGLTDKLNFLGTIRPERLLQKIDFDRLGRLECRKYHDVIEKIIPLGEQEIIKIQTDTGTFVCDGYPMHNCRNDVLMLENVYQELSKYVQPKTNMAILEGKARWCCAHCASENVVLSKTRVSTMGTVRRQMWCKDCHRYYTIADSTYKKMLDLGLQ